MTEKKVKAETTTYLIEFENNTRKQITVPSSWKVTFGPAVKGSDHGSGRTYKIPMAIRFYATPSQQKAIFTDVVSFRDMSIDIKEERRSTQVKEGFTEVDGVRRATSFEATVKEWVNPDKELDLPALPTAKKIFDLQMTEDEEMTL